MTQKQKEVPLEYLNGKIGVAIATGNNAAWLCSCGYSYPLVGRSGLFNRITDKSKIQCKGCGKHFYVAPDGGDYKRVRKVVELDQQKIRGIDD
ncbi:hypothetical protein KUW19_10090 [Ferrimonas balearica]|uniref:hypothetical protein n=1 Tax=Ferrimonas balearica TaxID=44012 RepID=UPI001C94E703|nr:hypothetical protein [Ferrimonas balearica]MBY6106823.1 hypothetical protein [Ferrimonas balearica]